MDVLHNDVVYCVTSIIHPSYSVKFILSCFCCSLKQTNVYIKMLKCFYYSSFYFYYRTIATFKFQGCVCVCVCARITIKRTMTIPASQNVNRLCAPFPFSFSSCAMSIWFWFDLICYITSFHRFTIRHFNDIKS